MVISYLNIKFHRCSNIGVFRSAMSTFNMETPTANCKWYTMQVALYSFKQYYNNIIYLPYTFNQLQFESKLKCYKNYPTVQHIYMCKKDGYFNLKYNLSWWIYSDIKIWSGTLVSMNTDSNLFIAGIRKKIYYNYYYFDITENSLVFWCCFDKFVRTLSQ